MKAINLLLILITTYLLLVTAPLYAQPIETTGRMIEQISSRRIIVCLLDSTHSRWHKSISKNPEKKIAYHKAVTDANRWIQKYFSKLYTDSSKLIYITEAECKSRYHNSSEYIIIQYASLDTEEPYFEHPKSPSLYRGYFNVYLSERYPTTEFYQLYTWHDYPVETEFMQSILFIAAFFKNIIAYPDLKNNERKDMIEEQNYQLSTRWLICDSANISYPLLLKQKDIDHVYASPYKLVKTNTLLQYTLAKADTTAIYITIPYTDLIGRGRSYEGTSGGSMDSYEKRFYYFQCIIKPSTLDILYYDQNEEFLLKAIDWKRFLRFSKDQKPNNSYQQGR
jgi:hypothetical protein